MVTEEERFVVAIVGSRGYKNTRTITRMLEAFHFQHADEVVSGGAKGPDTVGAQWARGRGIPVTVFEPDWDKHGKRAGFLRNTKIVDYCSTVVAFWDGKSNGTLDTIRKAIQAGKPAIVIPDVSWDE